MWPCETCVTCATCVTCVTCVTRSWDTPRAVKYREINRISGLRGTAVNVQAMGGLKGVGAWGENPEELSDGRGGLH
jgi:hypothetical protein